MSDQPNRPAAELVDVLIIGAGLAGLIAARELVRAGRKPLVLDKGRGVGGRVATRRLEHGSADHGAQYFTVREPVFRAMVDEWLARDLVEEWCTGFPTVSLAAGKVAVEPPENQEHPRYRGTPTNNALLKALAAGLDVRSAAKVERVGFSPEHNRYYAGLEDGREFAAEQVISTAPVEQSLALCDAGPIDLAAGGLRTELDKIAYDPCFAVMCEVAGRSAVPQPGGAFVNHEAISWVADNRRKGLPATGETSIVVIHASGEYSRRRFDDGNDVVAADLAAIAAPLLGGEIVQQAVHRWKFSLPTATYPERCAVHQPQPGAKLVFAGDAFGGPKVEGAVLSGLAAAAQLLG